MSIDLEPEERMALRVAWDQVRRGDPPTPNVATVCVAVLARVAGYAEPTVAPVPADDARIAGRVCAVCGGDLHGLDAHVFGTLSGEYRDACERCCPDCPRVTDSELIRDLYHCNTRPLTDGAPDE